MPEAASNKIDFSTGRGPHQASDLITSLLNKAHKVLETLVNKKGLQSSRITQLSRAILNLETDQQENIFNNIASKQELSKAEEFLLKTFYLIDEAKRGNYEESQIFASHRSLITELISEPETFDNKAFTRKVSELKEKTRIDDAIDTYLSEKSNRERAEALAKPLAVLPAANKLRALKQAKIDEEKRAEANEARLIKIEQREKEKAAKAVKVQEREEQVFQEKLVRMNFSLVDLFEKIGKTKKLFEKVILSFASILASFSDDQKERIAFEKDLTNENDPIQKEFLTLVLNQYFLEIKTAKKTTNHKKLLVRVIQAVLKDEKFAEYIKEQKADEEKFAFLKKTIKQTARKPLKELIKDLEIFKDEYPEFYKKLYDVLRKLYLHIVNERCLHLGFHKREDLEPARKELVTSLNEVFLLLEDKNLKEKLDILTSSSRKVASAYRAEIKSLEGYASLESGIETHIPLASETTYLIYLALLSHLASIHAHKLKSSSGEGLLDITNDVFGNFLNPTSSKYKHKY